MNEPGLADQVVVFWRAAGRKAWFTVDPSFDQNLRARFGALHDQALAGDLEHWTQTPVGSLALVLLLDQISRNLYRGSPRAFDGDASALRVAGQAVDSGQDRLIGEDLRSFLYMPFEHAEDAEAQRRSVELTAQLATETGDDEPLRWAKHHSDIIDRFGRFPHRNAVLGRSTSPAEAAFLDGGGFRG